MAEEAPDDQNNLEKLLKGSIEAYAGQDGVVNSLRERAAAFKISHGKELDAKHKIPTP